MLIDQFALFQDFVPIAVAAMPERCEGSGDIVRSTGIVGEWAAQNFHQGVFPPFLQQTFAGRNDGLIIMASVEDAAYVIEILSRQYVGEAVPRDVSVQGFGGLGAKQAETVVVAVAFGDEDVTERAA